VNDTAHRTQDRRDRDRGGGPAVAGSGARVLAAARLKDPSADRCLSVQLAPPFVVQPALCTSACCPGAAPPSASVLPGPLEPPT